MTERQRLIARKQAMQAAKNAVRKLEGIQVLELFERGANRQLEELYQICQPEMCSYFQEPYSRLPHGSSEPEICAWILKNTGLYSGHEYSYRIGSVWARIRIFDLQSAIQTMWTAGNYGFLLVDLASKRIFETGFDSRDEDHYLIDIFEA